MPARTPLARIRPAVTAVRRGAATRARAAATGRKMPLARPQARRCVLLADDDDELRELLAFVLRRSGLLVVEARDGAEVLAYVRRSLAADAPVPRPDVLITDYGMPGWSGFDVLDALRKAGINIPVIVITANGSDELQAEAARLRVRAVMDKPIDPVHLCETVAELVPGSAPACAG
ncbi:MAG: response regulator [Deltaproteobacteria bacterium]|nr:response regulator [Deltaproteobacteria bacterium]